MRYVSTIFFLFQEHIMVAILGWALIVAVVVGIPLLVIWSLNILFALGIAYTLKTWFAALVLGAVVSRTSSSNKKTDYPF
jgi:hypothetical protein